MTYPLLTELLLYLPFGSLRLPFQLSGPLPCDLADGLSHGTLNLVALTFVLHVSHLNPLSWAQPDVAPLLSGSALKLNVLLVLLILDDLFEGL